MAVSGYETCPNRFSVEFYEFWPEQKFLGWSGARVMTCFVNLLFGPTFCEPTFSVPTFREGVVVSVLSVLCVLIVVGGAIGVCVVSVVCVAHVEVVMVNGG